MKLVTVNETKAKNKLIIYIVLSYLFTWAYIVPKALYTNNVISYRPPVFLEAIAAYGPAFAAIIMSYFASKKNELRELLKPLFIWKLKLKWYLIALLLQPAIWLGGLYIHAYTGGDLPKYSSISLNYLKLDNFARPIITLSMLVLVLLTQLVILIGEEIGWRGYMLPKLLTFKSWIYSSAVLGLVWGLWHLPLFLIADTSQANLSLSLFFLDILASTFIFTWLYIHTRGSLLIAGLFHASINTSTTLLPILPNLAESIRPYILGIAIKCIFVSYIILKNRKFVNVEESSEEDGKGIKLIGSIFEAIFNFFEQIFNNMFNAK